LQAQDTLDDVIHDFGVYTDVVDILFERAGMLELCSDCHVDIFKELESWSCAVIVMFLSTSTKQSTLTKMNTVLS
jgi:cobalamin biosynthesis Mg chelatase CobN